ncbi:MAG TPA: outer membrane beta-barrel protein [Bacteroidia bacterium]|nr:outer membrane beta-barrel protein [Bacteroidia bacterium]
MLLIKAGEKRKRRIIGFIFFIGLVLGICVMIPFIGKESIEKRDIKNELIGTKTESSSKSDINLENKEESSNKIEKTNKDTKGVQGHFAITKGSNKVVKTNIKQVKENASQTASGDYSANANTSENKEGVLRKDELPVINNVPSLKQANNSTNTVFNETRKNQAVKFKKQEGRREGDKNDNNSSSTIKGSKTAEVSVNNNNFKDDKAKTEEVKNTVSISLKNNPASAKNNPTNGIGKTSDSMDILTLINSHLKKDTVIDIKNSLLVIKVDSAKPIVNSKSELFKKFTFFSIDAGANCAFGWTNHSIHEANGFNAVFGVSITHQFVKKWSVSLGLQYNNLAHLNYSNYTSNNLKYDLGYNQTKTVITPTLLYYLGIPVKLQYHFNEKNSLSIGVNALYLLNTNSKIETYTQSTFGAPSYNSSTGKGYMDGFSTWDIQPALAYRRNFFKCLSINAEVYYGLIDVKNNAVFGLAKSEHNSGFKLTLSYNLLHK